MNCLVLRRHDPLVPLSEHESFLFALFRESREIAVKSEEPGSRFVGSRGEIFEFIFFLAQRLTRSLRRHTIAPVSRARLRNFA